MTNTKEQHRKRRHGRIRSRVSGTAVRPRLVVQRSLKAIYAQLVDDDAGKVIASSSSVKEKKGASVEAAKKVGMEVAKLAKAKKVETCVFDRAGYLYHGRVKALAEGAREGGLKF
ncbi:MAG: 50S ribosomal protein L18 [Candidatus Peregrinibacteria bacterium]|nr:50S ribosomal protein L18 [Candidatus Peregrinibacteria bacterium]